MRWVTRAELHKMVGELPDDPIGAAGVLLRCVVEGRIDADQACFWTPEWQRGEREADADIAAGTGRLYNSDEGFLAALRERGL